jgi:hypothetical protein
VSMGVVMGRGVLTASGHLLCERCAEATAAAVASLDMSQGESGAASCDRCSMPVAVPRRLAHAQRLVRYLHYVGLDARLAAVDGGSATVGYRDGTIAYAVAIDGERFAVRLTSPAGAPMGEAGEVSGAHEVHAWLLRGERSHGRLARLPKHESGYNPYLPVAAV